jgi:hypothetical protein
MKTQRPTGSVHLDLDLDLDLQYPTSSPANKSRRSPSTTAITSPRNKNSNSTMPPAAARVDYASSIDEDYGDVEGIEVLVENGEWKTGSIATRIILTPRRRVHERVHVHAHERVHDSEENSPTSIADRRFSEDQTNKQEFGMCLADSFDSVDEIKEGSNEAKLLKRLAAGNDTVMSYNPISGLAQPSAESYYVDETEARYLDVLDRHLEETDPECTKLSDLDEGPDDPHPNKHIAKVDEILEHLLDVPCCECAHSAKPVLKSALRPSKWTSGGCAGDIPDDESLPPRHRFVSFKNVNIQEFYMTLGNHPSATSGPPVMLDLSPRSQPQVLDLESYEQGRQPRRSRRQLKLSLRQRHGILVKERGFSFEEVKSAWQEALEVRKQRKETLERGLALMRWDEVWESTCRKFNRLVDV